MTTTTLAHFVFVDFENVPTVDLECIAGKPVHVTLLIGEKQRRLELDLVRQIHRHAAQVTLIEVGASGRNALDLVLACHLGKAVEQKPGATFYIVSKDRDFDPLIAHLRADHVLVSRHSSFAELPCVAELKHSGPGSGTTPVDKLEKLIATLRRPTTSRPKRKRRLLAHLNAMYGNSLSEQEQAATLEQLIRRGVLSVDADGKVSYPSPEPAPAPGARRSARSAT